MQPPQEPSNKVILNKVPDNKLLMFKAAFKRSQSHNQKLDSSVLPNNEFCVDHIKLCEHKIAKYHQAVLWSPDSDLIHPCYLHTLAFPLHMKLILLPDFPFAALGLVHLRNQFTQFKPVKIKDNLSISCQFMGLEQHTKGWIFEICTKYYSKDELIWQSVSGYLFRTNKKRETSPTKVLPDGRSKIEQHKFCHPLDGNLGRQYAKVSGDFNPIHLTKLTAKFFGFKHHIAHGMWTNAYSLSMLEKLLSVDLVKGFQVEVNFQQPLFLPNQVFFYHQSVEVESSSKFESFSVQSLYEEQTKVHLLGQFRFI